MKLILTLLLFLVTTSTLHAEDKSHPRSLDPEVKIELFAEHPTIVTPTGIDIDHKGRVFAIESNTHFPPSGYKGHKTDRVLVLEDTNADGKADRTTVFTDGLTHTMSVAVKPLWLQIPKSGKQKAESEKNLQSIYIATRCDIFLFHDDNGDLKADRKQQIIKLETKGNYPHNGLAGFAFDAMGWMYFGFGENLGADYAVIGSDGKRLTGGGEGGNIYRCRPDGTKLTKWATGFWNPHASCVDAFGRLFTVDNDPDSRPPCRLLHIIEGGDYGFRFTNGRKGLHPFTAWNGEIPGTLPMVAGTGEAPSGIVAYESDGLPKKYIGNLLVGSWGDHRIDRFVLKPKGASFVSRAETLIQGGEEFRPVGLAVAPDGSLFCTDWVKRDYKLHGHGRIWRISRKKKSKRKVIDLATITPKTPLKELAKLLSHPRLDVRRMAGIAILKSNPNEFLRLLDTKLREALQKSGRDNLAYSALEDAGSLNPGTIPKGFFGKPRKQSIEERVTNRRFFLQYYLAPFAFVGSLNAWKSQKPTIETLLKEYRAFSGNDFLRVRRTMGNTSGYLRVLRPERVRLACILVARALHPRASKLTATSLKDPSPDVRRVAVQWVAEENLKQLKPQVAAVLNGKVMNTDLFLATLAALEMLDGKSPKDFDKTPAGKYVLPLVKDAKRPAVVRAQALRLVNPDDKTLNEKLMGELLASNDLSLKTEAVRTLQQSQHKFAGKLLVKIATDEKAPVNFRADAIAGLEGRWFDSDEGPKIMSALTTLAMSKNPAIKIEALRSARKLLIKTAKGGAVRRKLLRAMQAAVDKNPNSLKQPGISQQIVQQFALAYKESNRPLSKLLQTVYSARPKTTSDWIKTSSQGGDKHSGRRIFFASNGASCYRCHTVNGRGGNIGPDLSSIARTANRRKLAESILEPSKEIAPQFTLWSFVMASGQVHHGMILGDTRDNKQQIGTPQGTIIELPSKDIEERLPQQKSVMPEKLIDRLTASEFRDLLAFLESLK